MFVQLGAAVIESEEVGVRVAGEVGLPNGVRVAGRVAVTNGGVGLGGVGVAMETSQADSSPAINPSTRIDLRMPQILKQKAGDTLACPASRMRADQNIVIWP